MLQGTGYDRMDPSHRPVTLDSKIEAITVHFVPMSLTIIPCHPVDPQGRLIAGMQNLLLLATLILVIACSSDTKLLPLPSGSSVLALGDSLTEGAGVSAEEVWPALLATQTNWEIINGGVSGDTSEDALLRLPPLLVQHNPAMVLITLGGNDMLRHLPQAKTVANLREIIKLIKSQGALPILLATPNPSLMGAVFQNLSPPDFYQQVAKEQQVLFITEAIAAVLSDPKLKGDPLHPNAEGHRLLSEKIYAELKSFGLIN